MPILLANFQQNWMIGRLITAFDDDTIWIDGKPFEITDEWLDRKVEIERNRL